MEKGIGQDAYPRGDRVSALKPGRLRKAAREQNLNHKEPDMSENTTLHSHQSKRDINDQYFKAYEAINALVGDNEAAIKLIDFIRKLEMHHIDSIEALREIHSALQNNAVDSSRWHNEMNEMVL